MATKAYLLITSAAAADHSRSAKWIRDVEAMPEVESVYRILGRYDLLVTVEASAQVLRVADKIMANGCVEHLLLCFSPVGPALGLGDARARP